MPLGEAISRMTLSPILGRMLILGSLFGATNDACLLAAVIAAARRIFVCPPGKKKESLACVRGFSQTSDTLAAYIACKDFEAWRANRNEGYAERWAGELFLVPKRIKQLLAARDMHQEELHRAGLAPRRGAVSGDGGQWGGGGRWSSGWGRGGTSHCHAAWDGAGAEGVEEAWGEEEREASDSQSATDAFAGGNEQGGSDKSLELVKALLVAAYPQNLALRRRPLMAKHNTATGLDAIVAPQSVNAPPKAKASSSSGPRTDERIPSWWSYGSMQISNRQGFLRATTLVDPYQVALFGGLSTTEDDTGALREVDGWIELRGPRSTLRALSRVRAAIARCVHLRALEPGAELAKGSRALLKEVVSLLQTATPRQDRIADSLPENTAQFVEKPPPLPPPSRRPREAWSSAYRGGGDRGDGSSWASGGDSSRWQPVSSGAPPTASRGDREQGGGGGGGGGGGRGRSKGEHWEGSGGGEAGRGRGSARGRGAKGDGKSAAGGRNGSQPAGAWGGDGNEWDMMDAAWNEEWGSSDYAGASWHGEAAAWGCSNGGGADEQWHVAEDGSGYYDWTTGAAWEASAQAWGADQAGYGSYSGGGHDATSYQ